MRRRRSPCLEQLPELDADGLAAIIDAALTRQLAAGVTAVRDLGDVQWAVVERRDTPVGRPWIVASGPPLTSSGGHCANMGGEVVGRDAIVAAVAERAERGADVIKVMTSGGLLTPGTDLAACNFTDATRIVRAGIPVCPTIGWDPDRPIGPEILAVLARFGLGFDDVRSHVAELHRAGVRLISGSDAGVSLAKPHGVLRESVIDLIGLGVPSDEALASATGRAADVVGLGDRTGRLRAGLAADLLIVDGDPLTDPTALRDVRTVVARGVAYSWHESHTAEHDRGREPPRQCTPRAVGDHRRRPHR